MEILFICVNYNSPHQTIQFINRLTQLKFTGNLNIVVVDNSKVIDNELNDFISSLTNKILIQYRHIPQNLGYFGGANYGLELFLEKNTLPNFVIVCNVDIDFLDNNFLKVLSSNQYDDNVGVIAPSILSSLTNLDQNPYLVHRPTHLSLYWKEKIFATPLLLNMYTNFYNLKKEFLRFRKRLSLSFFKRDSEQLQNKDLNKEKLLIYAPHGSFFIFRQLYFHKGGSLNYPCFLFAEEQFVGETLRELGLSALYDPSLKLIHHEHTSMKTINYQNKSLWLSSSSRFILDRYYKKT